MINPITSKNISNYKRLMNNPATAEVWMTAFGKDFGGMSQGDNKTGQKGTNVMFVMLPSDVPNIPKDRVITYARVVVDHCPQKQIPIESKSQPVGTSSITLANSQHRRPTSQWPNSFGSA
jgi:hypothetical protein